MKAALLRVNYDPRYTLPHQHIPNSTLKSPSKGSGLLFDSAERKGAGPKPGKSNSELTSTSYSKLVQKSEKNSKGPTSTGDKLDGSSLSGSQQEHLSRHISKKERMSPVPPLEKKHINSGKSVRLKPLPQALVATKQSPEPPPRKPHVSKSLQRLLTESPYSSKDAAQSKSFTSVFGPRKIPNPTYMSPKTADACKTFLHNSKHVSGDVPHLSANARSKTVTGHSYVDGHMHRPPLVFRKNSLMMEVEKKARTAAENAIKNKKIFSIVGPYPILRDCLRKRGWVEKFSEIPGTIDELHAMSQNSRKKESNEDEDRKDHLLTPWQENHCYYGLIGHMVRNYTPTFVWTLKCNAVDNRYMKQGQIVNHYNKTRSFTTKVGLAANLKNAPWFHSVDPDTFYPRCFRMEDADEMSAYIDNYRLTACISILKIVKEKYKRTLVPQFTFSQQHKLADNQDSNGGEQSENTESESAIERSPSSIGDSTDAPATKCVTPDDSNQIHFATISDMRLQFVSCPPTRRCRSKKGGVIPIKSLEIAVEQCEAYLKSKEHEDIDNETSAHMSDARWDQLLYWYYQLINDDADICDITANMVRDCESLLNKIKAIWPQFVMEGTKNVWILKPGAKSRGRGITCMDKLDDILQHVGACTTTEGSFVVQKYIESPLLIYNTKFDIRQWFLVTDWNPLTIWWYKDCYLRFCTQQFTLENFHESVHLSNNSVQKHYKNGERSEKLPEENMWHSDEFQQYLSEEGHGDVWMETVYPGMKTAVLSAMLSTQEIIEYRKGAFELYGADFMITEDFEPWLIEINSSPSMARTTQVSLQLVDAVLEDTLKVVLDRRIDRNSDTGRFELAYKQPMVPVPPNTDLNIAVTGKRLRRPKTLTK